MLALKINNIIHWIGNEYVSNYPIRNINPSIGAISKCKYLLLLKL